MRPVFIGGCGRSGTTLLGAMLGSHPQYLTTPEAKFNTVAYMKCLQDRETVDLPSAIKRIQAHWSFRVFSVALDADEFIRLVPDASYSDLVRWIVEQYGQSVGKIQPTVWIDHTPDNILHARHLFDLYPDAKMIHLVRDGRAVAASVIKLDWGPNTVDAAANWWIHKVAHGFAVEALYGADRVMRVRYEDLVTDPATILETICNFLELEYVGEMQLGSGYRIPPYASQGHELVGSRLDKSRIGGWRSQLTPRQIEIIEYIADNVLHTLGYELLYGGFARHVTLVEQTKSFLVDLRRHVINRFRIDRQIAKAIDAAGNDETVTIAVDERPV
jgi:hypothetical protein